MDYTKTNIYREVNNAGNWPANQELDNDCDGLVLVKPIKYKVKSWEF